MFNGKVLVIVIGLSLGCGMSVFAQQSADTTRSAAQVIDIEAQILDARVELPQVQILDKRKKAKFEEVKVEKSFESELSGKTEELKFTPITSGKIRPIKNIEALLNKNRY